jgi:chloramphenicol O-acetyltransferase type A
MWGKWEEREGRLMMPVTLKLHHATGDGYHLSRFFLELEEMIKSL